MFCSEIYIPLPSLRLFLPKHSFPKTKYTERRVHVHAPTPVHLWPVRGTVANNPVTFGPVCMIHFFTFWKFRLLAVGLTMHAPDLLRTYRQQRQHTWEVLNRNGRYCRGTPNHRTFIEVGLAEPLFLDRAQLGLARRIGLLWGLKWPMNKSNIRMLKEFRIEWIFNHSYLLQW